MPILKVKNSNGTWSEIGGTSVVIGDSTGGGDISTCITGLSASGKTITYTRGNGTTGTITTQDTVYTHPSSHAASMITGGSTNKYLGWGTSTAEWKTGFGKASTGTGSVILGDLSTYSSTSIVGNSVAGPYSIAAGKGNFVNSTCNTVFLAGYNNSSNNSTYSFAAGNGNLVNYSSATVAGGSSNNVVNTTGSAIFGSSNTLGNNTTSTQYSNIMGYSNTVIANNSNIIGNNNNCKANYSTMLGYNLVSSSASTYTQIVLGRQNVDTAGPTSSADMTGALLIVGNGTESAANKRNNVLNLQTAGSMWLKGEYKTVGADYAEYFEWADSNTNNEDRRGRFVTIDSDEKIRFATPEDDYILGIVSATPSVVGDSYDDSWQGKFLRDIYGNLITETIEVEETVDEETGTVVPAHVDVRFVENPEYNSEEVYVPRKDRSEWAVIGMMGKLIVDDDGTCEVNGYATVGENGIATKGERSNGYRVVARLDESHIKVIFR